MTPTATHIYHNFMISRQKFYLDRNHASSRYLRKCSCGFIFVTELKQTNSVFVGLFATVDDPHEPVVIKKLWGLIAYKLATSTGAPWRRRSSPAHSPTFSSSASSL
ncbi:hypothetical protein MMYC01_205204 [Madurella mycetomatis]|uniref:Uncharacterized protein n=1 Tax=Madurella mycetomatis TaxID=100816 RepID=A0A175W6X6_9PEZI|nr:hypothetical protein MMYC01_205204 [Madurella mycetomatis]